jgi:hypothetical protein
MAEYKKYGALLIAIVVTNAVLDLIPWTYLFAIVVVVGGLIFADQAGWTGFNLMALGSSSEGRSSGEPEFNIEPYEAPEKLNEKLREAKGRKEIDIDYTSTGNLNFRDSLSKARIDGDEYQVWWVVGRAKEGQHDEIISYIYDLTRDKILHSNQNVKDPVKRVEPFSGKPNWLVVEGISARRSESENRADIQVNYGSEGRENPNN